MTCKSLLDFRSDFYIQVKCFLFRITVRVEHIAYSFLVIYDEGPMSSPIFSGHMTKLIPMSSLEEMFCLINWPLSLAIAPDICLLRILVELLNLNDLVI